MKYPTVKYIFDRRKKSNETRPGTIEIEISFERKRKWISTGVSVLPKQWDPSKLIIGILDRAELNMRIESIKKPIDDYIKSLIIKERPFTFEGLAGYIERKSNKNSFVKFIENRIDEQNNIKELTKKAHRKLISALQRFGKIETFDSLTKSNILMYDDWLHAQNYAQPTIHTYHKLLKRYINEALSRELIDHDPYIGMRIERGHPKMRKYLTEDEISMIRNNKLLPATLDRVRDLFIFQCYTGLAYADLANFDFSNVVLHNGKYVIHDQRQKTSEDYYIVLLSPALEILRKYDFKLPIITNQQYNLRLKAVADYVGLDRKLTTHMARHSFLCMALNHGVPIEVVAKMAGHTNIQTTQIYAKLVNSTLENAFAELERKLK